MIAIESINKKQNFISGIYKTKKKAEAILNTYKNKKSFKIIELRYFRFPFFIIEKNNKFTYYPNEDGVNDLIKNIKVIHSDNDDEEITYFTVYIIDEEYNPEKPEDDYMGILDHTHIVNNQLRFFKIKRKIE